MLSTPKGKAELYLASSLYDGLEDNNIVQVTTLLLNKEADPNVLIPSQGITPFHLVIGNDSETFAEEVTKLFLRHGGNPNVKSTDGMTPVHVAAAWGRLGVLELLLSNGGDPLLVDDDGRSPFHYAFDEAHYDAVATLGKYCGETFEDNASPKYNIALDKILVSNSDVVAEYVVAEETSAAIATNVRAVCTSNILNNNDDLLGNKFNKRPDHLFDEKKRGTEWPAGYPAHVDSTITSTTDESSTCLKKSGTANRNRRCLPRRKLKNVEPKPNDKCKIEIREEDVDKKNLANGIAANKFSVSHLNDAAIEASFVVKPRGAGENMPRISSPKAGKNLVKSEYGVGQELRGNTESGKRPALCDKKPSGKGKIVHKTPLRCRPRSKTPSSTTEKRSNLNVKTTPKNKEILSNDKRAAAVAFRTPNKNIFKQSSYSPDCSIVSKSPNLIITPTTPTDPRHRFKTDISSTRDPRKKLGYTPSRITTPKKMLKGGGSGEKNFTRFVKQSDLRYRGTKQSPASSPNGFHNSPAWSKRYARTPNLTDSAKHARKFPIVENKIATTTSYSPARSPATPLNKTYSKKFDYLDAAGLSPDVEVADRFIDRRTLAKSIAIKLEETRYDDDCGRNPVTDDVLKNLDIFKTAATGNRNHFKDPAAVANNEIFTDIDGRHNRREIINWDDGTVKERNKLTATVKKDEKGESKGGVAFSGSYDPSRASRIMAGFFQPSNANGESITTSTNYEITNDGILRQIPKLRLGSSNHGINRDNEIGCKMVFTNRLETPNSKEIDDSIVSSDASGCSTSDNYTRNEADYSDSKYTGALTNLTEISEGYQKNSEKTSEDLPDNLSSATSSCRTSFVCVEEEYKYEDAEEGIVLLERRLLVTPVSIPIIESEDGVSYSSARSSFFLGDKSVESRISSLPQSLVVMDSETLRRELTKLCGHPPGPITSTTRQVYLKKLWKLQEQGPIPSPIATDAPPKFSPEIERTLRSENWMNDLSPYETLEGQVFSEFTQPDPTRRWREGTTKSSFNYLLMDPRITDNLPRRRDALSSTERWRKFLSSIFYIGKGKRSRPYAHLYEASGEWRKGNRSKTNDKKIERILSIWKNDHGVVCLHLFQSTIPVEAYTREAAMIEALGVERLTNSKSGEYYGVAATWSLHQKRSLGVYLLYKAMKIFMNEGERQLYPDNIGR